MTNQDREKIEAAADACAAKHGVTMELDIKDDDPLSGPRGFHHVALKVIRTIPGQRPRVCNMLFDFPVQNANLFAHVESLIETGAREVFRGM